MPRSVLDDNRLLTMPNGERIQFANNVNFIFECHSLEFASPATVSRCGAPMVASREVLRSWGAIQPLAILPFCLP
jgi:dynein heavy chain 2